MGNIIPELCQLISSVHIKSLDWRYDLYNPFHHGTLPQEKREFLELEKTAFVWIDLFRKRFFMKNRFSLIDPCPNKHCLKSSFPTKYWHIDSRSYYKTRFNWGLDKDYKSFLLIQYKDICIFKKLFFTCLKSEANSQVLTGYSSIAKFWF